MTSADGRYRLVTHSRTGTNPPTGRVEGKVGLTIDTADHRYLQQLRLLAANWLNFDNSTKTAMKSAAFVLGAQHVPTKRLNSEKSWLGGKTSDPSNEYEVEWVLCKASEVSLHVCT